MLEFPEIITETNDPEEEPFIEKNSVVKIDLFKTSVDSPYNMIFTIDGLYNQNTPPTSGNITFANLFDGTDYQYTKGCINTKSIPSNRGDIYVICSEDNNIYYWNGSDSECKKLEGTFEPSSWIANHAYSIGDIVRPPVDDGYIYKCVTAGTSGSSSPSWNKSFTIETSDGGASWVAIGTFGLEGSTAADMEAKCVEYYKGFTFVANTKEQNIRFPSRLRWSQWQNPFMWHNNEDDSGMAGYVDIDDVEGEITAIKCLNDILVVYKEKGIVAVTFTGGETTFSKEVVTTTTGLLAPNAIIELPHSNIFIGDDNIYQFDGSSVSTIGDPIKNFFFDTLLIEYKNKIIGYYDKKEGDVIFAYDWYHDDIYPSGLPETEPDKVLNTKKNRNIAVTFNIESKTWSKREMYITAIGEFCQTENVFINDISTNINDYGLPIDSSYGLKDSIVTICGDDEGRLYYFLGNSDERRDLFEGYVVSKTHHMEDPTHIKRLLRIQFHIWTTTDCTLVVDVGTSWNSETQMDSWETHNINLKNPKPPFIDVDLSARFFQIRFGTKGNNEYFKVLGYTLYYQTRGDE